MQRNSVGSEASKGFAGWSWARPSQLSLVDSRLASPCLLVHSTADLGMPGTNSIHQRHCWRICSPPSCDAFANPPYIPLSLSCSHWDYLLSRGFSSYESAVVRDGSPRSTANTSREIFRVKYWLAGENLGLSRSTTDDPRVCPSCSSAAERVWQCTGRRLLQVNSGNK